MLDSGRYCSECGATIGRPRCYRAKTPGWRTYESIERSRSDRAAGRIQLASTRMWVAVAPRLAYRALQANLWGTGENTANPFALLLFLWSGSSATVSVWPSPKLAVCRSLGSDSTPFDGQEMRSGMFRRRRFSRSGVVLRPRRGKVTT